MRERIETCVRCLIAAGILATLSACGPNMDELQTYIEGIKVRPGGRIDPLPEIQPAPSFVYEAGDRRSPFVPDTPQRRVTNNPNAIQGPDPDRPREFLEQFPLDTLQMVGTLTVQGTQFGLVQTADGLIHRVTVGNHLGQNYGRITTIDEAEIRLVEIIPDGLGGYLERPAGIGLAD